jgi:toxin ParE1/3/4
MKLRFTRRAARDLLHIQNYSRLRWGEDAATAYMSRLRSAFQRVSLFARLGAPLEPSYRGVRRLCIEQHAVFYRVEKNTIVVLRVLHQRQDPDLPE